MFSSQIFICTSEGLSTVTLTPILQHRPLSAPTRLFEFLLSLNSQPTFSLLPLMLQAYMDSGMLSIPHSLPGMKLLTYLFMIKGHCLCGTRVMCGARGGCNVPLPSYAERTKYDGHDMSKILFFFFFF